MTEIRSIGQKRIKSTGKVAILGTRGYPSYYGGFETLIRRLAPFLVKQGWDVTVYGRPGATKRDDLTATPEVTCVNTFGIESQALSTLSFGLTSVFHSAFLGRPDAALIMNVANGFWLPLLKICGIPSLVNVDGIEWERAKWGRAAKMVFRIGAKLTAIFADGLIFDSVEIARRWDVEFGRRGYFIPYGGDQFDASPPLGLKRCEYVLVVARFVPENTIEEFLTAAKILSKTKKIVIVGSSGYGGDIDDKVRELASSSDNVTWLGHVSDDQVLHSLWSNAAVYFHGHSVGGTNPALVQAMACGAPIVARDTVYNREVLNSAGIFVEPTPESIVDGIARVFDSTVDQERLGSLARARVATRYTWDGVCTSYNDVLQTAVDRRSELRRGDS